MIVGKRLGLIALAPQSADAQAIAVASGAKGKVHLLPATLETTNGAGSTNAQPPVLRIDSGDTLVPETMMHSHNQAVPGRTIEDIKNCAPTIPAAGHTR